MSPQVLLITHADASVDAVRDALARRGLEPVVLVSDRFPAEVRITIRADNALSIRDGDQHVVVDRDAAVWYRRLRYSAGDPDLPREVAVAVQSSVKAFLKGVLASREGYVLHHKWRVEHVDAKPRQLSLAAAAGLDVPATISTTRADEARAFAARCGGAVITKMFSSFAVQGGQVMMTTPLTSADLAELSDSELSLCPATFQERLRTEREYRVTVVGDKLFSASLSGAAMGEGAVDWRRDGARVFKHWRPDPLPEAAAAGLLRLMARFGLDYGAADFIRTTDGRVVFLEVNPAGEFLWLDPLFEGKISEAIAALLAGEVPRRGA